jgi:hypothetical protein
LGLLLSYIISYNLLNTQIAPLLNHIKEHDKEHSEIKNINPSLIMNLKREVTRFNPIIIYASLFEKDSKANSTGFIVDRGKMSVELSIFSEINTYYYSSIGLQVDCCCICEEHLICGPHKIECLIREKDTYLNISFNRIYKIVSDCVLFV